MAIKECNEGLLELREMGENGFEVEDEGVGVVLEDELVDVVDIMCEKLLNLI